MADTNETTKTLAAAPAASTEAKAPKAKASQKPGFFSQPDGLDAKASTNLEIVQPSGGQIALTAHNDGDGTWSVTRGPGGTVLAEGLAKEEAVAIVGAPTDGSEPKNEQERRAIEARRDLEEAAADAEVEGMFKSDAEVSAEDSAKENV